MAKPNELIRFSTPTSTANLGPGYRVLGLALDASLTISVEPRSDGGMAIERRDDPDVNLVDPRHDSVLRSFRAAAELLEIPLGKVGYDLIVEGDVPRGVGMGTNSAGFAAGIAAAARLAKQPWDRDVLLDMLVELGGDPGHGAASLAGGLVAAVPVSQPQALPRRHRLVRHPVHPSWRYVVVMPDVKIGTADAKRVLPPTLPHPVSSRTAGRVLGVLHALAEADGDLLAACLYDEVHVPYRRRLASGIEDAMARGVEAGASGATISGHGPGVVAFTTDEGLGEAIGAAMAEAFTAAGVETRTAVLEAVTSGGLPEPEA